VTANTRARGIRTLILLVFLFLAAVLIFVVTNSSTTHSTSLSRSYINEEYTIELTSSNDRHYALQNSEFALNIIPVSDLSNSESKGDGSSSNDKSQLELINPVITLQMLQMDCGTVSAIPQASSSTTYHAEAAPLMKGIWVATATFALAEDADQTIVLSYQFEVS